MAAKQVILIHPHTGEEHKFDPAHAERIMALPDSGGWTYKEEPKKKKGKKDASNSRSTAGKATTAEAQEEDCGCD